MHPTKSNLRFNTYTYNHPKPRVLNDSIRTCSINRKDKIPPTEPRNYMIVRPECFSPPEVQKNDL